RIVAVVVVGRCGLLGLGITAAGARDLVGVDDHLQIGRVGRVHREVVLHPIATGRVLLRGQDAEDALVAGAVGAVGEPALTVDVTLLAGGVGGVGALLAPGFAAVAVGPVGRVHAP